MKSPEKRSAREYSEEFDLLWHAGSHQAAEELLRDALISFPIAHEVTVKWARLATMQRNYEIAAGRWLDVLREHPTIEECYKMGAFCCTQCGDGAAAVALLQAGMRALPGAIDLWLQCIELAITTGDLCTARATWTERQSMFSADFRAPLIGAELEYNAENYSSARALVGVSLALLNASGTGAHSELMRKLNESEMKAIVGQFESLGGRMEGCEFGLFQRVYGAEPLGLLRWSDIAPDALIDALEHGFEGVGEPWTTILSCPHAEGADWTTQNARYGMNMHTFQYDQPTEETKKRLFDSTCRRLQFLRRKLLADLSTGEKIFVYKVTYEVLDEEKLVRLHGAIRRFGRSTLLYVRQPNETRPAGTVEWIKPGLMIGYIARFSYGFGHGATLIGPATEHWELIVRRAHDMWLRRFEDSGVSDRSSAQT